MTAIKILAGVLVALLVAAVVAAVVIWRAFGPPPTPWST